MRDDGYLINIARGPIVDEDALVTALESETIAGAALDVLETEPLPAESPLLDFEDIAVSPNRGSATNRYHLDIADLQKRTSVVSNPAKIYKTGLRESGVRYESSLKPILLSPPNEYELV